MTNHFRPMASLAVVVLLVACAAATSSPAEPTATASAPSEPPATPSTATTPRCPNPNGGECLGELEPGTYQTVVFEAGLTYTVPAGWANYEDLPGNFLLVPPGSTLEDVDAGTGEYIGVYEGVALADGSAECIESPDPDHDRTPEGMAEGVSAHEGLSAGSPEAITIRGLAGLVVDVTMAEGYKGTCPFAPGGVPVVPLLIGTGPAGLHHVLTEDFDMRLYLLTGPRNETIAIEVVDVPGRQSVDELSSVVEQITFGQ